MDTNITATPAAQAMGIWYTVLATCRKMFYDNRKKMTVGLSAYMGFWFVIGLLYGTFGAGGSTGPWEFYAFVASVAVMVICSLSFHDMRTKEGRLTTLMMPANVHTKFWPRFAMAFLGSWIIVVIGYLVMNLGRLIGCAIIQHELIEFGLPQITFLGVASDSLDNFFIIVTILTTQAIYFFGAILWPRLSFVKTTAVLMGIQTVFILIAIATVSVLVRNDYDIECIYSHDTNIWIAINVMIVLSVALIWMSYRRFRKSSVIYGMHK